LFPILGTILYLPWEHACWTSWAMGTLVGHWEKHFMHLQAIGMGVKVKCIK
jgi:hypothetical protein